MMLGVEFSLHPFKIHCTALKVRAMVVPLVGNVPVPGKGIPMAIPAGDPTALGRGNTGKFNQEPHYFKKWYFVTIIVLTYCEKKLF